MARGPRQYFPGENEGDVYSRMVQVIRQLGYNEELSIDVGVITKLNPMEITFSDGTWFEEDDFTLPERLTKHIEYHNGVKVTVDPRLTEGDWLIGLYDDQDMRYAVIDRIKKSEADEWIEPEGSV